MQPTYNSQVPRQFFVHVHGSYFGLMKHLASHAAVCTCTLLLLPTYKKFLRRTLETFLEIFPNSEVEFVRMRKQTSLAMHPTFSESVMFVANYYRNNWNICTTNVKISLPMLLLAHAHSSCFRLRKNSHVTHWILLSINPFLNFLQVRLSPLTLPGRIKCNGQ